MNSSSTLPLVTLLSQRAYEASVQAAGLLEAGEHVLIHGRFASTNSRRLVAPEDLLALTDPKRLAAPRSFGDGFGYQRNSIYPIERLARLVARSWNDQVETVSTRPDVLAIVCEYLSNPDEPYTYDVVRFAVTLALRTQYQIAYHADALVNIRRSYDSLRERRIGTAKTRISKRATKYDYFLIDVLCLDGRMRRRFGPSNVQRYYDSFSIAPFGVESGRPLALLGEEDAPTLLGELPDFGDLINVAFTQPTGVPGLDAVTGGLLGPVLSPPSSRIVEGPNEEEELTSLNGGTSRGLITFIGGVPGSGKTSLALLLARRLSELGSVVRYISTEEEGVALRAKAMTMAEPLSRPFADLLPPESSVGNPSLEWIEGESFESLGSVFDQLRSESLTAPVHSPDGFYLAFPRVVVIDSVTALMEVTARDGSISFRDNPRIRRRELARVLAGLRHLGLCVILVGSLEDARDVGLAYVVDNLFTLGLDGTASARHPVRLLSVEKTRLQRSSRGGHVFHLGGLAGCSVSPSLHSVLKDIKHRPAIGPDANRMAVFWVPSVEDRTQQVFPGVVEESTQPLTIRDRSQILLYGAGPAGKARFALAVAIEPKVSGNDVADIGKYFASRRQANAGLQRQETQALGNMRVLVVSFLYPVDYYRHHLQELLKARFPYVRSNDLVGALDGLDVLEFTPGYIDPETVVSDVREYLRGAELDARPFTAVIIDGVHNVLMQFPLLERDPLLWSALHRYLRTRGITTITTFTFFGIEVPPAREGAQPKSAVTSDVSMLVDMPYRERVRDTSSSAQQLFFQLLVGTCDYTFSVTRPTQDQPRGHRELVRVVQHSAPETFTSAVLLWDPSTNQFRRER